MKEIIDRCIDGGACFMMAERGLSVCTRCCAIRRSFNDAQQWRNIEELAKTGNPASARIIERAEQAVRH